MFGARILLGTISESMEEAIQPLVSDIDNEKMNFSKSIFTRNKLLQIHYFMNLEIYGKKHRYPTQPDLFRQYILSIASQASHAFLVNPD